MTGKQRTINFLKGEKVDRIPFHPLVMQYAAEKMGTAFGEYCQNPVSQCQTMLDFSRKYGMDSTHPSGYAYCEASAYGLAVTYPENNLPYAKDHLILDFERDIHFIRPLDIESNKAMMNRVEGVRQYVKNADEEIFICGHAEGPLAEYCDLRGAGEGFMDLFDYENEVKDALQVIVNNTKKWIDLQAEAGCHCMSIGDAISSQISEDMYLEFVFPFHKQLIDHIKSKGIYSKFHICGDTSRILPHLASAGANIMDVDHLVCDIEKFVPLLKENQVFCGNLDPVSIIKNASPEEVYKASIGLIKKTKGKCILSGGCEIPLGTPMENYQAMIEASKLF